MDGYKAPHFEKSLDSNTDWIRLKVEREGTQARNIVKYNLPFSETCEDSNRVSLSKRHHGDYSSGSRASSAGNSGSTKSRATASSDRSSASSRETSQRSLARRRQDYHALYWGQMLDTLKRTIDEIYAACELDECEMRCKEVIMILTHSEQDFKSLIEKMSLLQQFGNRPTSLAWDERKISPGRPIMLRVLADLDLSPTTLTPPSSSTAAAAALAWGSDEEDLLNDVDEEEDVEEGEETHFDAAIKSVASTERLLRSELGREEASLRQLGGANSKKSSTSGADSTATPFVCCACAGETQRRSVAVATDGAGGDFLSAGCDLLGAGKPRIPGRGVQMHEKLLAQNRGRCERSIQEIEAKQARARFLRQRHLLERSNRVRELSKKVEEVRKQKLRLIQQRRNFLEQRLLVADANRRAELKRRILKAHDEEIKGREIAFIQSLEAEQKQHTIFAKHEISCARLRERAEVRRRRLEEKAEREEAAKLRRIELEALRLARLDELQARWISRAHEIEMRGEQTRLVRRAAARERELHREMKLASLEQQQRQHIEELRSKIVRKQLECERRHQETLSGIRRKALEMSAPQHDTTTATLPRHSQYHRRGWCRLCRVEVDSVSHFESQEHRNALLTSLPACLRRSDRWDIDRLNAACFIELPTSLKHQEEADEKERLRRQRRSAEVERQKLLAKRLDVVRQRMNARSILYRKAPLVNDKLAPSCPQKAQLQKHIKEARRYCNLPESGPWVASRVAAMEKALRAIRRLANDETSLLCCYHLDLPSVLVNLIDLTRCQRYFDFPVVPTRTVALACELLTSICQKVSLCSWHLLFNCDLTLLLDCLTVKLSRLEVMELWEEVKQPQCPKGDGKPLEEMGFICALFSCLLVISRGLKSSPPTLTTATATPPSKKASNLTAACLSDFVAYAVNSGLMEVLTNFLSLPSLSSQLTCPLDSSSPELIDRGPEVALKSLQLLTALVRIIPSAKSKRADKPKGSTEITDDPTFFFDAVAATEVFGIVSLLYDTLQMSANPRAGDCHDGSEAIGQKFSLNARLAEIVLNALRLINCASLVNLPKIQEIVSNDSTSIQVRHIMGLLFSICAPKEDESEVEKDVPSPAPITTLNKATTSASGGCLVGKSRRNASALIPSGAKEVGLKVTPKEGPSSLPLSSPEALQRRCATPPDHDSCHQVLILHEAIICLGYLTLGHLDNQTRLCVNGQSVTPLLLQLCQLPLNYFSQPVLADILFPTLIACCFPPKDAGGSSTNTALLAVHLNPALLANFIEARILEKTLAKPMDDKSTSSQSDDYHQFENRFPPSLWPAAKTHFREAKNTFE
ncbi:S phase cyclin A-associated protein in the endoplasmic reticulum [Echinococcus granulosus]|uniref:S phase cyclin A-associated protein in the endoplasmic reticulum n=1 Tax=Echinococcus granulosus TaxID=6210 RepID=W6U9A6_ECHGR|nr:S phase cyclin A-associated protein in the endoplasmic reticulum [Echinococcus granulosus]EUB57096.1 S phase cyclin A-associated protein in the endoplasmic reticulum [Echinococcus granulosus]